MQFVWDHDPFHSQAKQKELEGVVNPIMMKVYQAAGGGGMPEGGMPGGWKRADFIDQDDEKSGCKRDGEATNICLFYVNVDLCVLLVN